MPNQISKTDPEQAKRFLLDLGKNPDETYIRTVTPKRGANLIRRGSDLRGFDADVLDAESRAGANIFYVTGDSTTATGKKPNGQPSGCVCDKDITICRSLFVEHDHRSIEWQLKAWQEQGLPEPSVMVTTGGKSVHCYWKLVEPIDKDTWSKVTQQLIKHCGSDPACKNPSRLMRLPGFAYIDKKTAEPNGNFAQVVEQ